ncbi:unknown [Eubacterium sp. CAG:841]|nr:unknown [Eubacterium sp. CAG:841]
MHGYIFSYSAVCHNGCIIHFSRVERFEIFASVFPAHRDHCLTLDLRCRKCARYIHSLAACVKLRDDGKIFTIYAKILTEAMHIKCGVQGYGNDVHIFSVKQKTTLLSDLIIIPQRKPPVNAFKKRTLHKKIAFFCGFRSQRTDFRQINAKIRPRISK